ncbi:MAG: N-acetylneuraminate synthase [SAR202 cluster bacterium]|nr:N-acetylneuraminate synthase [SAR202 cluster bacterium]
MARQLIDIAGRKVGPGQPCFIIAEAGVNHNGSLELAHQLVDAAVQAGADAVKFQSFNAELLVSPDAPKADYQLETTDAAESQLEMIRRLELSPEAHGELMRYCQDKGILFMSSPFDELSADLLGEMDVAVYKIPSGEITNLPFLAYVARKAKPMIVSTGMTYLSEVEAAVRAIQEAGNHQYVLLHCVSNYPADPADVNLRAMATIRAAFGVPVGYSDHTMGTEIPIAAVAMGASMIEKHVTLDRNLPGPDHRASLEPWEFAAMVRGIRNVESALGHGRKEPASSEANTASVARKSLVAAKDIPAGATLTEGMIAIKRPGTGLPPVMLTHLTGRTVRAKIPKGALITLELLA